ncbi:amidohydrolase [Pseudomonas taiwanensis]|uniref:amidohydrolase family protein n=1 Tax=Pseudomonas taiwanensis TaxID=470150 RepID=UPI0015BE4A25|nr:amidohydrolase family protein [Pseudomonas taiwanensis]NWL76608.1 amidohydrolase [Pseudomonas taiwanensis]
MNRRNFISSAGVIIGGSAVLGALPVSAASATDTGSSPFRSGSINAKARRVDVHHHFVPSFWAEDLAKNGGDPSGWKMPKWSPESDIEFMDELGIDVAMLSLTAPGVAGWKGQAARDMARRVNEYAAGLGQDYQGRFGSFVTLPMQDIDGAIKELDYCLGRLKADGVILLSNYEGIYLGDKRFEPIWEELNRREAVVLVHPTQPKLELIPGIPGPTVDYPFDTTRAALSLLSNRITTRFSKVRIILSHAGGFIPYGADRFAQSLGNLGLGFTPDELIEQMRSFYFDTALSASATVLPSLMAFAKPGHVLFGSDIPYAINPKVEWFTRRLDNYEGFAAGNLEAINRQSALPLFPRLSK